jgi:aerobic carbon-monoxide dehydrogenase large subunit
VHLLGSRVPRKEDERFLRGRGRFVENASFERPLFVTFARSILAHAQITGIGTGDAAALPGVVEILTGGEIDLGPLGPPPLQGIKRRMTRPLVATDVVRFVGEIVAIVVSEERAVGVDAAEAVRVDYEPLPVVVDPSAAATDELLLFPELGTNVARSDAPEIDDDFFAGCEVVVSGTHSSQRVAACPLEPRSAAAQTDSDGRLTVWLTTQTPHRDKLTLERVLGVGEGDVRVLNRDVGGSFGSKLLGVEEVLVAWLARRLGRAVRWTETRSESMVALYHGRGQRLDFRLGGSRDGRLHAYQLDILADAGAYPGIGASLPALTKLMAPGPYAIPRVAVSTRSVVTNTTPTTQYRGAGRPEATQAIERALDIFAHETGLDPAAVRRRNFVTSFPYESPTGARYDSGDYSRALELALEAAKIDELREEQRRRRADGSTIELGIGLASYVEITNPAGDSEFAELELGADGTLAIRSGSFAHGQGHETAFAMIAAEKLGLPLDAVSVEMGDTDLVQRGSGTFGSKSIQIGGSAVEGASRELVGRASALAAELLGVSKDGIVFDSGLGRFSAADAPHEALSWAELARRATEQGRLEELRATCDFKGEPTFGFGAHVAVVEVDVETGKADLLRLVAVDDAGNVVNPLLAEGQVHGGLAMGVGQALLEKYVYDEDGNPLTTSFSTYHLPSSMDVPRWESQLLETPTPLNPLGSKGIGEGGTVGSTAAVQNAVVDALAPYGVRHVPLPANGENVWRALEAARAGSLESRL